MELNLLNKTKDTIEIEVIGEDETLLYPLQQKLVEDESVEYATYIMGHPLLENPKLVVRVKEGKPQNALKRASKALANKYKECLTLFKKESK
jgi:DNA-directed RNA polymerase subunit L